MTTEQLTILLSNKRIELLTRIHAIEQDMRQGRSPDFAEQTTETENDQVLDEIYLETKQELNQVNQSLVNMKNGHYGLCSKCGAAIARERLRILPHTSLCANCAH